MTERDTDLRWSLTLYVAGASPRSAEAIDTVRRITDEELAGRVELNIVDVSEQPPQRWWPPLDQGRHREDVVADGRCGPLADIDDAQLDPAGEFLVGDPADGVDRLGRAR